MPRTLLLAALLAAPLTAQGTVHVVDPFGQGDFTHLQTAVDAAADGDTLLLRPAIHQRFVIVGKSLTLVADGSGPVWSGSPDFGHNQMGPFSFHNEIRGLSASQSVVLRGLTLNGLEVADVDGLVWVQDCTLQDISPTLRATNVASLVLQDCVANGPGGAVDPAGYWSIVFGHGVEAIDSGLAVDGCTFTGGNGQDFKTTILGPAYNSPGGDALRVSGGSLWLAGSTLTGGDGGAAGLDFFSCTDGGDGGAGLRLLGDAPFSWSLDNRFFGGAAGAAFAGSCGPFSPGPSLPGDPGAPVSAEAGSLTSLAGDARSLSVSSPVKEGHTVVLQLDGQPGEVGLVLLSLAPGLLPVPGKHGALLVGPPPVLLGLGTLTASGSLELVAPLGELGPGLDTVHLFVQAAFCSSGCVLGPAEAVCLLDAQF